MNRLISGPRSFLLLTFLCAALFLPGISSVPPTDRDEARFMQASKQMIESGDYISIRFQDEPRTKKPVGIHWLQVAAVKGIARGNIEAVWAYRIPSVLAAWLSIIIVFVMGQRHCNRETGFLAATLTACSLGVVVEGHLAKTDATLLLTVILTQFTLAEFYRTKDYRPPMIGWACAFWLSLGAGLLIKGPIILGVVGVTVLALATADRSINWAMPLKPWLGIPITISVVLPWLMAANAIGQEHVIWTSLSEDFLPKLLGGVDGHGAPPGTYLALSPLFLWPASLIIIPGVLSALKYRSESTIRFVLAWGLGTWLMFEAVPTKLPHYIVPAIPAFALSAATVLARGQFTIPTWSKSLWTVVSIFLSSVLVWAAITYGGSLIVASLIAALLCIGTITVWLPIGQLFGFTPIIAMAVLGLIFSVYLPSLTDLNLSSRLEQSIRIAEGKPTVLTRYREPSAVFLIGTETRLTTLAKAIDHMINETAATAAIAEDELKEAKRLAKVRNRTLVEIDQLSGYNYSKARAEDLVLIRILTENSIP